MESPEPVSGDLGLAKLLFTDASCRVSRQKGQKPVAAWAAMLVAGERSMLQSGLIAKRANDTTYCELLAVAASLDYFSTAGLLATGDRVQVFLDNWQSIAILSRPLVHGRDPDNRRRSALEHVRHLETARQLTLGYSWVRGHQGPDTHDWRGLIHSRVDRLARHRTKQELNRQAAVEVEAP